MNILFVINGNYPYSSTGTNLLNKLFFEGGILEKVQRIDVLGGKDSYFDLDFETMGKVNIYRAWAWSIIPKDDVKLLLKKNMLMAMKAIVAKTLFHLKKVWNKNHFIEEDACEAYYRALYRLKADEYDAIVTMSGRYYQTAAVMRYCNETGQKFVFYQVDPCGTNKSMFEETLVERLDLGKKLYESATVVLTTPIIYNEQQEIMPAHVMKKVIPMEFPLISRGEEVETATQQKNGKLKAMFIGSIYAGIRNPDYTIRLFRELISDGKVEFHFVGVKREEISEEFEGVDLMCHGTVPLAEAMAMMRQADFLVNIGNSVVNQVPSKIFDYISTGKPVVNICKSRKCPTLSYFEKYRLGINLFEEDEIFEEQVVALRNFVETNTGKQISYENVEQDFVECTPRYCAKQIMDALERV